MDRDYTLRYLHKIPRYARHRKALLPSRVYPDPNYPFQVAIVELPFDLPLWCERVNWDASRLSHRLPFFQPDQLNFFAKMTLVAKGKRPISFLFVGKDVFTIFKRWCYFVDKRNGKNLLQVTYKGKTPPVHPQGTYEAQVVNYQAGAIFADHHHLRRVMDGITV